MLIRRIIEGCVIEDKVARGRGEGEGMVVGEGGGEGEEKVGNEERQKEIQSHCDTVFEKCPLLFATASSSESQHPRFASHVRFSLNVKQKRLRERFPPVDR